MKSSLIFTTTDLKGRKQKHEFWFYDTFIAVHVHLWTDNEKFAKEATKHRYIFGAYYCAFETFIPKFIFKRMVSSEECVSYFIEWYKRKIE